MCWRDDTFQERRCFVCGQRYFGDLGHFGCQGPKTSEERTDNIRPIDANPMPCLCSLATGVANPELVHHDRDHCGTGFEHEDGSVQCSICWITVRGRR